MNIVLCAIDTKYIHTNLALRLLKANCPFACSLMEFTIKDGVDEIVAKISATTPDLVAFSVYLWNVGQVLEAVRRLHAKGIITVAGGPEVAFDVAAFMGKAPFDYLIKGEGEKAFAALVLALDAQHPVSGVFNLVYREGTRIRENPVVPICDLGSLQSPYRFPEDESGLPHKIHYLELSRGCPFACTYCLAPLDGGVRFFPLEKVEADILDLLARGAKTFKFLDRTFNVRPDVMITLCDFIIANALPGVVFQFEITADILPMAVVDHLNVAAPPGLFRFEIGIQSTNPATNAAVNRKQDNPRLFSIIKALVDGGKVIVHLDLIAGLPAENLSRFRQTFDEAFALHAPELQLGFLKMLRGTPIRRDAANFGYVFDPEPPYEIRHNDVLSVADLQDIHLVEDVLERYWNKGYMVGVMKQISFIMPSMFDFFLTFGRSLESHAFPFHRHQLADLFAALDLYLQATLPAFASGLHDDLKREYLERYAMKPKIWWSEDEGRKDKNAQMRRFYRLDPTIPIDDLYKYGVVTGYKGGQLLLLYRPSGKIVRMF
ncbi:MAG: DUF4080 domain-containing protein [bacterium]